MVKDKPARMAHTVAPARIPSATNSLAENKKITALDNTVYYLLLKFITIYLASCYLLILYKYIFHYSMSRM